MKSPIKNILITCANGSSSLYLAKQLRKKYKVFLVDGGDEGVAQGLGLPFHAVPMGNDPKYLSALERIVKKWKINCIVPGADEELEPAARLRAKLGVLAVMPADEFIRLCLNKKNLMKVLAEKNISSLSFFQKKTDVIFPAVVKPVFGRGSREMHVVHSLSELDGYLLLYNKSFADVLVQPYIAGDEYTVSLIVNNTNEFVGVVSKKVLSKKGITKAAVTVHNAAIERVCQRIVAELRPYGPCNVQLKFWHGKAYIFEINPRLSTTSVLTDKAFGNEVDLYIRYYNQPVKRLPPVKENVYLFRYDENVFR